MKILLISSLYPLKEGHYQTEVISHVLHHFAREWVKDHDVQVIRPLFINLNPFKIHYYFSGTVKPGKYSLDHVPINALPVYRIPKTEHYLTCKIKESLKSSQFRPDIIITHMGRSMILGNILSHYFKIPFFAGVHISDLNHLRQKGFLGKPLVKALRNSQGIACRSPYILHELSAQFPDLSHKIFPAYSGIDSQTIDIHAFKEKRKLPWLKGQKLIISTVSSLIRRKNTHTLISALSRFTGDWYLHIAGDGPERPRLEKLVNRLGLNDRITFYGYIPQDEVQQILSQSHLFVMPSENETFGIIYLEAMGKANIVIGGKNTGIDGFISDGREGFLVTPGDTNELYTLLNKIYYQTSADQLQSLLDRSFSLIQTLTFSGQAAQYMNNIHDLLS